MQTRSLRRCLLLLLAAVLFLSSLGCARRADMDDIRTLQSQVDSLLLKNHDLEQRVAALEAVLAEAEVQTEAAEPIPPAEVPEAAAAPEQATYAMTADEICSQMLKDGLPVASFYRRTEKDDPDKLLGTEMGYTSRVDFRDLGIPTDLGTIEVFSLAMHAGLRESVLKNEIKSNQRGQETIFRYDNVLLRLPAAFSEEQALRYEEGLRKVLGIGG